MNEREKTEFLAEINGDLPGDIDWKRGALEYISNFVRGHGNHARWFTYSTPFGDNYSSCLRAFYNFLNTVSLLDLPKQSRFIDVGCGSGWIAHFLAKFNYEAVGIDISEEMIEIARERVRNDKFTPFENVPFAVDFLAHDIEKGPLPIPDLFDAAIFESALHHFFDPVAALENIAKGLKEDGLIVILEGAAPPPGYQGIPGITEGNGRISYTRTSVHPGTIDQAASSDGLRLPCFLLPGQRFF